MMAALRTTITEVEARSPRTLSTRERHRGYIGSQEMETIFAFLVILARNEGMETVG